MSAELGSVSPSTSLARAPEQPGSTSVSKPSLPSLAPAEVGDGDIPAAIASLTDSDDDESGQGGEAEAPVRQAVDQALAAAGEGVFSGQSSERAWTASKWISSLPVGDMLGAALLGPLRASVGDRDLSSAAQLEFVKALAAAPPSAILHVIRTSSLLDTLARELHRGACKLVSGPATAQELHGELRIRHVSMLRTLDMVMLRSQG